MNMRPDPLRLPLSLSARPVTLPEPPALHEAPLREAPLHEARALTGGGLQARIALDGQVYTLRITRAGKLILTK